MFAVTNTGLSPDLAVALAVIVALIAAGASVLVALITAGRADSRQTKQLEHDAERQAKQLQHDADRQSRELDHDRRMRDLQELRSTLDGATDALARANRSQSRWNVRITMGEAATEQALSSSDDNDYLAAILDAISYTARIAMRLEGRSPTYAAYVDALTALQDASSAIASKNRAAQDEALARFGDARLRFTEEARKLVASHLD